MVKVLNHEMFADPDDDFDGWGMVRQSWVRLWDAKRADLISVKYDFKDYGKTWIAYSYKTLVEDLLKRSIQKNTGCFNTLILKKEVKHHECVRSQWRSTICRGLRHVPIKRM